MNRGEQMKLLTERKFLEARLTALPGTSRIMRISTESRLKSINERIASYVGPALAPARVRLTFNGRPVVRSQGIFAEFGAKAITNFIDAISAVAASLSAPLAPMGPIPNKDQHQLLITSTALGSFGFELEEFQTESLGFDDSSPVAQALERTQNLLLGMLGTDDELADSASDIDPRALDKIRAFLLTLVENEAVFAMGYRDRDFKFTDVGQVRASLARLESDNLQEQEQLLSGEFQGVLPKSRTFEFKLADQDFVIKGKVGASIIDPDSLNNQLHLPRNIKVMMTKVGNGRPRYVLTEIATDTTAIQFPAPTREA